MRLIGTILMKTGHAYAVYAPVDTPEDGDALFVRILGDDDPGSHRLTLPQRLEANGLVGWGVGGGCGVRLALIGTAPPPAEIPDDPAPPAGLVAAIEEARARAVEPGTGSRRGREFI